MLHAKKVALQNVLRQRLVAIRERELLYYTDNCRNIGNGAAIISGLAYSGIRYHYLLERNTNYNSESSLQNSFEEALFLSLLTVTLGCSLQTVFISMLVALFGPQLALRGPDGSLHDAVEGMHRWNSVIIALFMTSLILLQLSAFSLMYGHSQLSMTCRAFLLGAVATSLLACLHYMRKTIRRLSLPKEMRVSGAFFAHTPDDPISSHQGIAHEPFRDSDTAGGLSSSRPPMRTAAAATRIEGDEQNPLTAEALDHAINEFYGGTPLSVGRPTDAEAAAAPATAPAPAATATTSVGPALGSCTAMGVFPSGDIAVGSGGGGGGGGEGGGEGGESEDDDEERPLNARLRERPAVRVKRQPRRVHNVSMQLNLGAPAPHAQHVAPQVSWREELRLLHRILFQPVAPERSLRERGGFGRDDFEKVVEQETLLGQQQQSRRRPSKDAALA